MRYRQKVEKHLEHCSLCFSNYLETKMDHARVNSTIAGLRPEVEDFADRVIDSILDGNHLSVVPVITGTSDGPNLKPGLHKTVFPVALVGLAACVVLLCVPLGWDLLGDGSREANGPRHLLAESNHPADMNLARKSNTSSAGSQSTGDELGNPRPLPLQTYGGQGESSELGTLKSGPDSIPNPSTSTATNADPSNFPRHPDRIESSPQELVDQLVAAFENGNEVEIDGILNRIGSLNEQLSGILFELGDRLTAPDQDPDLRRVLVRALGNLEDNRSRGLLIDLLENEQSVLTRRTILQVIAENPPGNTTQVFLDVLANETDPKIRRSAIRALGVIGSQEAFDAIRIALQDPDNHVAIRQEALSTISLMLDESNGEVDFNDEGLLETFEDVIATTEDLDTRLIAVRAISKMAPNMATRALEMISSNETLPRDIKEAAIRHIKDRFRK